MVHSGLLFMFFTALSTAAVALAAGPGQFNAGSASQDQPNNLTPQVRALASAAEPPSEAIAVLLTRDGKTYKGVKVLNQEPDGLWVSYVTERGGTGIAKLQLGDLPEPLQRQYGYDPRKAANFTKEQAQRQAAQRQARQPAVASARQPGQPAPAPPTASGSSLSRRYGTGFFVARNGWLLTAAHLVESAAAIDVKMDNQQVLPARVFRADSKSDLALLQVNASTPALPLGDSTRVDLGSEVFTIGFPQPDLQGVEPKFTEGTISSLAGLRDAPELFQISVPVQPGNSGGPLIDAQGNVIGLVVARLRGGDTQNVNYAIKSEAALKFLEPVWEVKLWLRPPNTLSGRKLSEWTREVKAATVLVIVTQ
jgi:S1-C subfamily serine protease